MHPTSQEHIYDKLCKLKTDKSPGVDMLHPRVLFETRDIIDYPLYLIYSKSLELGILPSDWKLREVTAIYKKDLNRTEETIDLLA